MSEQNINCPNCGSVIPLNDVLTKGIRLKLEQEMKQEIVLQEKALAEKERVFLEGQKNWQNELAKKMELEKMRLWKIAQEEAAKKQDLEMQNMKKADLEKELQLDSLRKELLTKMDKERELESRDKNREIEFRKKMEEMSKTIVLQAKVEAEEQNKMKLAEKEKQLDQLKRALEEANKKAEQGSMQVQGDAQENDLKMALQSACPIDLIEDVPTGVRGADIVQHVLSNTGQKQGIILWESKNTKVWNDEWVLKLKEDQALVKADLVIIATQTLPAGIDSFGCRDGVWITAYKYVLPLMFVLRTKLLEANRLKQSMVGKDAKLEMLFNYLGGPEFKNRIETIVLAFDELKRGLDMEKRAMEKIWNRREKEIERITRSTVGFYGDLEGILGQKSLPLIAALELPAEDDVE